MERSFQRMIRPALLVDVAFAVAAAVLWLAYLFGGRFVITLIVAVALTVLFLYFFVPDVRFLFALRNVARKHEATLAAAWYAQEADIDPNLESAEWKQEVAAYYKKSIAPPYYSEPWA